MHIRPATVADVDVIAEFNSAIASETENIALVPEVIRAGVEALLANPHHGFYSLAEVESQPVGSIMITTEWSDWRNGLFWWIQSVYVRKSHRRQGIYRAMYQYVKELAEQTPNVCGFRLYVEHENTTAQKTYASMGMEKTAYRIFEELKPGLDFSKTIES